MRPEVSIDEDLMEIMPSFIKLTQQDYEDLDSAIKSSDFESIKSIAHTLKGDCGGYGFEYLSEVSKSIEDAAVSENISGVSESFKEFSEYWELVKNKYNELLAS